MKPDDLLSRIVALLAPLVAEHLADRNFSCAAVYSTAPGGTHPGSRRWFLERVRKHPKARRIGGKRGRGVYWEIDRADWEATTPEKLESPEPAPVVDIDSWIRAGGYRSTRSA